MDLYTPKFDIPSNNGFVCLDIHKEVPFALLAHVWSCYALLLSVEWVLQALWLGSGVSMMRIYTVYVMTV